MQPSGAGKVVRLGGASGFWGDSMVGAPQLVHSGLIDYLVFDYLAETTLAIMAAARARKPEAGYATDFVDIAMKGVLGEAMKRGIKVVANAGGINPRGCAEALRSMAAAQGLSPRIAVVEGDDVAALMPALRTDGTRDMYTGEALPEKVLSASAYLGALPIARALGAGADIVITGRGVDSAVTLGPLIHEFGWSMDDHDRLAGGSLAGHIIECGCQATGGLHTDWERVPDWPNIGYPVIECVADGSFVVTKPAGTGGIVLRAAIAEQLLYEIGDPAAYLLPDVGCDFSMVQIEQLSDERVGVSGARGFAPTDTYKVSATAMDGYRCAGTLVIVGIDAAAKARRTGEAIIARTRRLLSDAGLPDFTAATVQLLGAETLYGPHARTAASREVMLRVVVDHPLKAALEIFAREIAPAGTSWSPGTTGASGGRPSVAPLIKPFSFLLEKTRVSVGFVIDGKRTEVAIQVGSLADGSVVTTSSIAGTAATGSLEVNLRAASGMASTRVAAAVAAAPADAATARRSTTRHTQVGAPAAWVDADEPIVEVPLIRLAWARSGDKGDLSNIGVIARRPEWLPLIWARLTPVVVEQYFAHLVRGRVERFYLPGIAAINYLLHEALEGGGPASTRMDPLGKGMAQMLLDLPVAVPASMATAL